MKIEVWFDFLCPFSYIGINRFIKALDEFENKNDVRVVFRSFCIAPYVDKTLNIDAHQFLSDHKDVKYEDAKKLHDYLTKTLLNENINFNFEVLKPTTSKKAHQVFKLITDSHLQRNYLNYIFKAYFEEGKDISNLNVLQEIGIKVGLNKEDVEAILTTDFYSEEIKRDFTMAETMGLNGVPAFVIDESFYLLGGQPQDAFLEMLEKFYHKTKSCETTYCIDNCC